MSTQIQKLEEAVKLIYLNRFTIQGIIIKYTWFWPFIWAIQYMQLAAETPADTYSSLAVLCGHSPQIDVICGRQFEDIANIERWMTSENRL